MFLTLLIVSIARTTKLLYVYEVSERYVNDEEALKSTKKKVCQARS